MKVPAGITPVLQLQNDKYNCDSKQHAQIERKEELSNMRSTN